MMVMAAKRELMLSLHGVQRVPQITIAWEARINPFNVELFLLHLWDQNQPKTVHVDLGLSSKMSRQVGSAF
jgi:hypothetical protein